MVQTNLSTKKRLRNILFIVFLIITLLIRQNRIYSIYRWSKIINNGIRTTDIR
jgi:hypothetical protein